MPSLLKTAFLQLNKWAGNEYPKREDFVSDNEKIDTAIKTHATQLAQTVEHFGLASQYGFVAHSELYRRIDKVGQNLIQTQLWIHNEIKRILAYSTVMNAHSILFMLIYGIAKNPCSVHFFS